MDSREVLIIDLGVRVRYNKKIKKSGEHEMEFSEGSKNSSQTLRILTDMVGSCSAILTWLSFAPGCLSLLTCSFAPGWLFAP